MNLTQTERVLRFFLKKLPRHNVIMEGTSGIGKTEVAKFVSESAKRTDTRLVTVGADEVIERYQKWYKERESGIGYQYLNGITMQAPDLMGFPTPDKEKGVMRFLPPEVLMDTLSAPAGVMLFDEVNRFPSEVQHALMQVLDSRQLGTWKLPPGWLIVGAVNPLDKDYQVKKMALPFIRRWTIIRPKFSIDSWRDWAIDIYKSPVLGDDGKVLNTPMQARVVAFAGRIVRSLNQDVQKPLEQVCIGANLRKLSEMLDAGVEEEFSDGDDRAVLMELFCGTIGDAEGQAFMKGLNDELVTKLLAKALDGSLKPDDIDPKVDRKLLDVALELELRFWEKILAGKTPKKFAKQMANLYRCLPRDLRTAFMKRLNPYMQEDPEPYQELAEAWEAWCTERYKRSKGIKH